MKITHEGLVALVETQKHHILRYRQRKDELRLTNSQVVIGLAAHDDCGKLVMPAFLLNESEGRSYQAYSFTVGLMDRIALAKIALKYVKEMPELIEQLERDEDIAVCAFAFRAIGTFAFP